MKKILSLVLVLAMVLSMFAACGNNAQTDPTTAPTEATPAVVDYANSTVILYTGNVRGNAEVYSQIAAAKAAYEEKGATVYLVDAGNYLQGTAYANSDMGLTVYNLMDAAGYDVAGMGVYEFVHGEATTGYMYHGNVTKYFTQAELVAGSEELEYQKNAPWAETAVMDTRAAKAPAGFAVVCSNLNITSEATGYYAFENSAVLGDALKVGFVSYVPENVATYLQDNFLAGYMLQDVTAPSCDVLVALNGTGDISIEAAADGALTVGAYVIDNTTKAITAEEVELTGTDADVDAVIAAAQLSNVVGKSEVILDGSDRNNWNGQTNLGALTADALAWYAANKIEDIEYPIVAIQNGGNCDNFIYTGEITEVDMLNALPFSPMGVGVVAMTGEKLLETLEASTQSGMCPGWAQVSGIEYTVDTTVPYDAGEAYGDFFMANSVNRVTITTEGFDPAATYAVVCDRFLINGNDTYYTMADCEVIGGAADGVKTRDVVAMYIDEVLGGTIGADYAGELDSIQVESKVEKAVIYISSLGGVLNAFGKSDCIVGAYGSLAESYGVPSCGSWNSVDVEAVIATGADAIFGYAKYTTDEQIAQLRDAGIFCYFIELSNADTAADEIMALGELFGCEAKAQEFVDLYNKYDALLKDRLATVTPLNVYVEGTNKDPFKTANGTSAAHKLVTGAGLNNLYGDHETTYPERNLEDVITKNPDIVVKLCGGSDKLGDELYDAYVADLAGVAAVDAGKVIMLNNECGTTAIGSVIGRLYIAKYAYPELFEDVDVDAVYEELRAAGFCDTTKYTGSGAFFK